jgi:protein-tyrosine-phosphatase
MAEAILNRLGRGKSTRHTNAAQCSLHVSNARSKPWDEFTRPDAPNLDFVFTVCDNPAKEVCPVWPGQPMTAHWGLPDPAKAEGNDVEKAAAFADTMRMLNQCIGIFVNLLLEKLSKLSLQKHLDDIGKVKAEAETA